MKEMKIEYLKLADIQPYENNPRNNDEAVEYVANSIREFGFKVPIIIDKNNVIVAGHTRLKASELLGLTEVPCIRADDLTDDQIKAFRLADNKVSEIATWNLDLLREELDGIEMAMEEFGFEDIGVDDFDIEDDDFEINEETFEKPTRSKVGEIYKLGDHRLMVGDSTIPEDVEKLMNGDLADLVVTDPPYNVNVSNTQGMTIANDNMQDEAFYNFLDKAFRNMANSMKEGAGYYVWYGSMQHINFASALVANDLSPRQQLIWVKSQHGVGHQDYQWQHETCLYGWKEGAGHYFIYDRAQSTVFEKPINIDELSREEAIEVIKKILEESESTVLRAPKPVRNALHPTMKPIELIGRQIYNSSENGWLVLDLFGGSGSTLIACEQLGRTCYMMEYDPRYADVIIDRWEELTGKKARKIGEAR